MNEKIELRDYFAAKAMQAYLTSQMHSEVIITLSKESGKSFHDELSKLSFEMAELMIKNR